MYKVVITSSSGGGANDQEALIYAGKVVEEKADEDDPDAKVSVIKNDSEIGPTATVADMLGKSI